MSGGIMKKLYPMYKFIAITFVIFAGFISLNYANESNNLELTIYSGYSSLNVKGNAILLDELRTKIGLIDLNHTLKGSFLFGAKLAYYLNKNLEIEAIIGIAPGHDLKSKFRYDCPPGKICMLNDIENFLPTYSENIIAYNYDSNLIYNFNTDGKILPYISAGLGGVSYDINDTVKTMATINAGIGIKWYLKNIGLRFELNEHAILNHFLSEKTEYNFQIQYGLLFKL